MTAPVRPKTRSTLSTVEIDGETVVFHPGTRELHHLNPQATVVFRCFDGTGTLKEIGADIADAFGLEPREVERQVRSLYRRFADQGLLDEGAAGEDPGTEASASPVVAAASSTDTSGAGLEPVASLLAAEEEDEPEAEEEDGDGDGDGADDDTEPLDKLDRLGWVDWTTLRIGERTLGVRTNSHAVGEWLRRSMGTHVTEEEALEYDYSVYLPDGRRASRSRGYNVLYVGTSAVVRTFHAPELGAILLAELAVPLYAQRTDAAYLRAGLLQARGRTVLLDHRILTYLGRNWRRPERAGLPLPAEQVVAIDPDTGMARPMPAAFDLPDEPFAELAGLPTSSGSFARTVVDRELRIDLVCAYDHQDDLVQPLSGAEAVVDFATVAANLRAAPDLVLGGLRSVVSNAQCSSIRSTRAQDVVDALVQVLRPDGPTGGRRRT